MKLTQDRYKEIFDMAYSPVPPIRMVNPAVLIEMLKDALNEIDRQTGKIHRLEFQLGLSHEYLWDIVGQPDITAAKQQARDEAWERASDEPFPQTNGKANSNVDS